ncbi:MAG TPA: HAD family hydrolase [Oscillospiraceae bacterium]|nr:HAD family hydrolase [Oscillospiraceae bacterium]HPK36192.1 HAD family hydrolase [Oscillospiraceae bacterium]HPR75683.1 HAD family hydrolase [Oscillospiraceae bacterium]
MKPYKTVLFDLDGTLTDPGLGITNSVKVALEQFEIHVEDNRELYPFVGPPLIESFMKFYGLSREQTDVAIGYFREYFQDKGIFENVPYEGINTLLADLKAAGKTLVVATSKPEVFAKRILERFDLAQYFTFIAGANLDETRTLKSEVIEYALNNIGPVTMSECVMVGDREHDVLGAKVFGMDSIGVLYGYGSREEFEKAGATYIAESVEALRTFIL